jgi:hypothetical protein
VWGRTALVKKSKSDPLPRFRINSSQFGNFSNLIKESAESPEARRIEVAYSVLRSKTIKTPHGSAPFAKGAFCRLFDSKF